ncbi:hypothetical protein LCGC14_1634890 [marine sediment metagenome]|uniref:Uncharacterized protein n=1 Tax=marine sediment metagenome TaxID=412755 RepID=A0A0F9INR2_9ZZZZ
MINYIKHSNIASFNAMNDRIYKALGYERIVDNATGETVGDRVKTHRYARPINHPTNGTMLMIITPATRHHPDGSFTNESPEDVAPDILTEREKANMKGRAFWKQQGYFPDPVDEVLE